MALCSGVLVSGISESHGAELTDLVKGDVAKVAGDFQFTEGPAWHPDGYLLFSDIPSQRIVRCNPDGTISTWMADSRGTNGLMCDRQGNVYACQGEAQRIARLRAHGEGGTLADVLADKFEGKPFNRPNDLSLDSSGGLYFSDPIYGPGDPSQPVQGVYYISAKGEVSRVIDDLPRPNGVLVSPDGKSLVVANPNLRQIIRYAIESAGKLSSGKVLFTGDEEQDGNGPDGMTFDNQGNLYATYKSLVVLNPSGQVMGRVEIPEKPSNCALGGQDMRTLYITARTSLYAIPMNVAGLPLHAAGPGAALSDIAAVKDEGTAGEDPGDKTREVQAQDLKLNVPVSWTSEPLSGSLRLAQFAVPPAEGDTEGAAFVVFPPFGGTVVANIQRWLGQFDEEGREVQMFQGSADQGDYVLVDIAGTYNRSVGPPVLGKKEMKPGFRVVNVMFSAKAGGNYFFKLEGPQKTVAAQLKNFRKAFGVSAEGEKKYTPNE